MTSQSFCNINNILSCFPILCSELEILGFDPIRYEESNEKECIAGLVNSLWSLISSSKKQVLKVNELNEQVLNLNRKLFSAEEGKKRCLQLLENEKTKSLKLQESLSEIIKDKEKTESELRELKTELKSINLAMTGQQLQFEHDIRRKESDIEDLQRKLFNILGSEHNLKIEKSSVEGKSESLFDSSIFRSYILALQNNIQILLNENVSLRTSIVEIYLMILKSKDEDSNKHNQEKLFKLPYQNIINEIEEEIRNILQDTNQHVQKK